MKKVLALALCMAMLLTVTPVLAEGSVYTALYGSEVSTLNYLSAGSSWDQTVGANVIDTLVEYDNLGNVIPGLAESWENSEDQLTWTFHLRQGQKWYDNTGAEMAEVTAQDFVDAMKYVLDPVNESGVAYTVYTAHVKNAELYYKGLAKQALVASGTATADQLAEYEGIEPIDFSEVGVKAVDTYTLQYTLDAVTPYFLSCLTYGSFMPAYGPLLEQTGKEFGTACDKMYYCGAFILTEFEPQVKHTYVKNQNNWDAANVHLDGINRIYNSEAATLAPTMALRGEVDSAELSNDIIDDWKQNHADIISRGRIHVDYSYFYCFNFDPKYDAQYDPDSWRIAVNNSDFRHSLMSAFDRTYAMRALEPDDPDSLLQNTITPATFVTVNDGDYTALPAFDGIADNFFNADKALAYKEKALTALKDAGVTFPVQIVLTYKSGDTNWENEYVLLKQQLEGVLGTDYINCVLYAGPSESFLASTRKAGMYSMMRCNWGADYADPQTWTDPFVVKKDDSGTIVGNNYNKMDLMLNSDFTQTKDTLNAYYAAVDEAKASTTDTADRYAKFAAAEAMLINNALVIPYSISPTSVSYQVTKLNIFEGEYAPFGMSNLRYKYQTLASDFITADQYAANHTAWLAAMGK